MRGHTFKNRPMRGPASKHLCQRNEVQLVSHFERALTDPMLLGMVGAAQADGPTVGRLERATAIGAGAHMGALDGSGEADGDRATMLTHPGAVCGAGPGGRSDPLTHEPGWQMHASHA